VITDQKTPKEVKELLISWKRQNSKSNSLSHPSPSSLYLQDELSDALMT